ncbi:MAG TPA: nitroreductase family protein [Dysgonomonas sp.]|nr:nitroreductase family protein [Dysgonomonas sp.]
MKTIKYISIFALCTATALFTSCGNTPESTSSKNGDTLSVIHSRKSVRSFIKDRPVEKDKIETLLKAAMAAPSGRDTRPWEFVVIDDREMLDRMAEALPTAKTLADAPMAIVVCGDTARSFYWYLDCSAATQNLLLAAEASGLGAVWTAAYPYTERMQIVVENTNMPAHILPLAVVPVGYPEGEHTPKDKFDASRIRYNKW